MFSQHCRLVSSFLLKRRVDLLSCNFPRNRLNEIRTRLSVRDTFVVPRESAGSSDYLVLSLFSLARVEAVRQCAIFPPVEEFPLASSIFNLRFALLVRGLLAVNDE